MPQSDGNTDTCASEGPTEQSLYADAATRVHKRRFEKWYYAIDETVGQGAVGMATCLFVFAVLMLIALFFRPI